jgi:Flp pilus assembly protein CpaB
VYWLQPPSVVRRAAAVLLVVGAIAWDLNEGATETVPVAAGPIDAGATIETSDIAWIEAPADLIPHPDRDPAGSVAAVPISTGDPFIDAVLSGPVTVPSGWWTVPIAIGTLAAPGDEVMLVVADPPVSVIGRVIKTQVGDTFDLGHRPAAVAVPPDAAPIIAAAAQQGLLVTAVRPTPDGR